MNPNQAKMKDNNLQGKTFANKLPCNLEAERAILAILLYHNANNKIFNEIKDLLTAEDFCNINYRAIYESILSLRNKNQIPDLVSITDHLDKNNIEIPFDLLVDIQESIPSLGLLGQYINQIKESTMRRNLAYTASLIAKMAYDQDKTVDDIKEYAEKHITAIITNTDDCGFKPLSVHKTIKEILDAPSNQGVTGIPSGFTRLDKLTGGFQNGNLVILAARPAMGKTSLAINIAKNITLKNYKVGIISLEMSQEELELRLVSDVTGISVSDIKNKNLDAKDIERLTYAPARLNILPMFISDDGLQNIANIKTNCRKLKRERDVNIIFIDYLQLIYGPKKFENKNQEITEISRSLKHLAKELSIPIVCLSQLSREVEGRNEKRPILSDLRDSGAIEQDADIVMFLYRDVVYNKETEHPNWAELIISKQRNGPTGKIDLYFEGKITKFVEYTE